MSLNELEWVCKNSQLYEGNENNKDKMTGIKLALPNSKISTNMHTASNTSTQAKVLFRKF